MEDAPQVMPPPTTEPISRPSSTSTSASASASAAMAAVAAAAAQPALPAGPNLAASNGATGSPQAKISTAPATTTYAGATPAGNTNGNLPTCQNCTTSTTPLWRRDEMGAVLCNACGLFLKLHGRPRPISLKTDVIKSRNRVKTMRPDLITKKKQQQQHAQAFADANGADLSSQSAAAAQAAQAMRRASQKSNGNNEGADSPISRTGTPSMYNSSLQFMVDDPYQTAGFSSTGDGQGGSPMNGDSPQTHEQLIAHNSSLKTRVSELEVINELFRGRLSQLEQQEAAARRGQEVAGVEQTQLRTQLEAAEESEAQLRAQLEDSHRRENNLKRRLDELEVELTTPQNTKAALEFEDAPEADSDRPTKRARLEEESHKVDDAAAPTPEASTEG